PLLSTPHDLQPPPHSRSIHPSQGTGWPSSPFPLSPFPHAPCGASPDSTGDRLRVAGKRRSGDMLLAGMRRRGDSMSPSCPGGLTRSTSHRDLVVLLASHQTVPHFALP